MSVGFVQGVDIEVFFDVWCAECNEPLCSNMRSRYRLGSCDFLMPPCENCIENARSEGTEIGYEEGIVEGRETGKIEGRGEGYHNGYEEGYEEAKSKVRT